MRRLQPYSKFKREYRVNGTFYEYLYEVKYKYTHRTIGNVTQRLLSFICILSEYDKRVLFIKIEKDYLLLKLP